MNLTRRRLSLVVILGLFVAACGRTTTTTVPTTAPTAVATPQAASTSAAITTGDQITIGASLPLTGRLSEPGIAAKQGYATWAALVNANGGLLGRQVALHVLDNASDQQTAVADYEKLITADKVDLVFGTFSSFLVIPTSEVAAKYGYAFIEPAGGAPEVFNRGLTNLFFAQPATSGQQAEPFAEYILNLPPDQRPKTFAVVSLDDPFTLGVMEQLKLKFSAAGIKLVLDEVYSPEATNFAAIAGQVAALNPDLLVGGTLQEDSISQIKAYQQAGYQPRGAFFTSGPSFPDAFRGALGPATNGIFSAISWFADTDTYQNQAFVTKYVDLFGGDPQDIPEDAANAFTVGQVLQQAAEKIQSIDNAQLIKELHTGSYNTIVGRLSFDEDGRPEGSFMILQWQDDRFVIVAPSDRAQGRPVWPKPQW